MLNNRLVDGLPSEQHECTVVLEGLEFNNLILIFGNIENCCITCIHRLLTVLDGEAASVHNYH